MENQYRSEISESVHRGMSRLRDLGLVDVVTMRQLDETCLLPIETFTPEDVTAPKETSKVDER